MNLPAMVNAKPVRKGKSLSLTAQIVKNVQYMKLLLLGNVNLVLILGKFLMKKKQFVYLVNHMNIFSMVSVMSAQVEKSQSLTALNVKTVETIQSLIMAYVDHVLKENLLMKAIQNVQVICAYL